jgi:sec-independent protein translocase protein TatA
MQPVLAFFEGAFAPSHIILILIVGVLLFGNRLPEIGRSLGRGLVEFKKGIQGLGDEVKGSTNITAQETPPARPPQRITATPPRFEDPAGPRSTPQA